jgi:hypothetical protein
LAELGPTSDAIATTLRDAKIKGLRQSIANCPVARFVTGRIMKQAPSLHVKVAVSDDTILITRPSSMHGDYGDLLMSMELPDSVTDFLQRFDADAYPDLVDKNEIT